MNYKVPHFINGEKITSNGKALDIYNPALGTICGQCFAADNALVDKTVKSANAAFQTWSATTPLQRAKILFRYKTLLEENIQQIAQLVTNEHGKTLEEALGSVRRGIDVVDYACGIPNLLKGSFAESVAPEMDCYSLHQPLGVCVGITPFNFPAMIPLWMFPLSIACGNTFILKPSEKDPSCSILLAELALAAGVPKGVVNVLQGDKETVDALLKHSQVAAVSFVGSSVVAEYVYQTAILAKKRVQAFGGAKNHCVVMPDADIVQTAKEIVASAYGCAGERCMAISVVVAVGDDVADELIKHMQPHIKQIQVGPGSDKNTTMGPLITKEHRERVKSYISIGKAEGAQLVIDGESCPTQQNGFYMSASLFDHVQPTMRIYREEIFGPVLIMLRVPDFAKALQLINEHEYGNGTAIFTRDGYIARQFAEKVQVGMVGVNVAIPVPVAYQSFGGWKQSIFSDIGMYGAESIRFYTKLKTVTQRWLAGKISS